MNDTQENCLSILWDNRQVTLSSANLFYGALVCVAPPESTLPILYACTVKYSFENLSSSDNRHELS